ncbi:STAS domain-containing protein [Mesobacillus maritimus]|uniref:STAS domain-containing protein n=1 Tax=Mesobacillus maritimus TaxID=1643336 RepID=UPI00203E665A|nr:STAS domain-containing protein [Mesobacillus maritimus]MCM3586209.1 STAS domain-containing protein [Mesobacillus maritimus]MCM3667536.1 STAS domain-containing protein [Mesobacillus maritimus]
MSDSSNSNISVGGLKFGWNLSQGQFLFEEEDAVLFWISSAMKTFFDTIEEISGEEATNLVLETTGFRQGLVVGEYFKGKNIRLTEVLDLIPNTYASAGWGSCFIKEVDEPKRMLQVELRNSWEYKINKAQGKKTAGKFLPAHYAGILSGLFGENIWFRIISSQLEGNENDTIEYFPSDMTVTKNIHKAIRLKESNEICRLERMVEKKTSELKSLVRELSSPIIPVLEGIVVVPLVGRYDNSRSDDMIEKTLNSLPKHQARYLIVDLTALHIDEENYTAHMIEKLGAASTLIGTKMILVGISAELSVLMTQSGFNFAGYQCFQTLQHGIYHALAQDGHQII